MKLDRTTKANGEGTCKYALVKLRKIIELSRTDKVIAHEALETLKDLQVLDYAAEGDSECFVIRLKDVYAVPALLAYANAAAQDDPEYAQEIANLAVKSQNHPNRKRPD